MRESIVLPIEARKKICRTFGVTDRTVRNAINNLSYPATDIIKRIRRMAEENGGKYVVTLPMFETIHTADGKMKQIFPNGAVLIFYREDGRGELWYRDALLSTRQDVSVKEIFEMQKEAAKL